jgi:IS5 family transposase
MSARDAGPIAARGRVRVEHLFGTLKHQLGYRRVRYRGRDRNELDFALTITACNIKRSLSLQAA